MRYWLLGLTIGMVMLSLTVLRLVPELALFGTFLYWLCWKRRRLWWS